MASEQILSDLSVVGKHSMDGKNLIQQAKIRLFFRNEA